MVRNRFPLAAGTVVVVALAALAIALGAVAFAHRGSSASATSSPRAGSATIMVTLRPGVANGAAAAMSERYIAFPGVEADQGNATTTEWLDLSKGATVAQLMTIERALRHDRLVEHFVVERFHPGNLVGTVGTVK